MTPRLAQEPLTPIHVPAELECPARCDEEVAMTSRS
jgi:hypothetical protein